ncbi:hypothetical protein ABT072_27960 [Streptomyces sp. NPDC002589]|uniref:hypothetical protein n=1 Tax=Streptomyces sp. NPDC002589 TaxID=3154420 RepID=UPI00331A6753
MRDQQVGAEGASPPATGATAADRTPCAPSAQILLDGMEHSSKTAERLALLGSWGSGTAH